MKHKQNTLSVCLLALLVTLPSLIVISIVWQKHLDFVETQYLLSSHQSNQNEVNYIINLFLSLIVLTPLILGLGIYLYERYVMYRAAVLQRKIEMLERLWQQKAYSEEIIL
ncbi:hypothetical protein [Chroococcidiopsis sp. TS-821]|uniref:hypothetical protein n=1 Tax=Chroococcidiopsis sp. TS-821 TaxID=1378066 RepID=UPI000CEDF3D7|nr:hypothetical protein [Chroococcidiopsis sp. TS-821]PPS44884.1 hypothetical protein B1A85_00940 [Chroococcidiopsis sp. TS-821]